MKKFKTESPDAIEKSLRKLLQKNRYLLSVKEFQLLIDCIIILRMSDRDAPKKRQFGWKILDQLAKLIFRFLSLTGHLKNFF